MKNKLKTSNLNKLRYGMSIDWVVKVPFLYYKKEFSNFLTARGAIEGLETRRFFTRIRKVGKRWFLSIFLKYLTLLFNRKIASRFLKRLHWYKTVLKVKQSLARFVVKKRLFLKKLDRRVSNMSLIPSSVLDFHYYNYFDVYYLDVFFVMPLSRRRLSFRYLLNKTQLVRKTAEEDDTLRASKMQLLLLLYVRNCLELYLTQQTNRFWNVTFYNHYLTPKRAIWWGIINRSTQILHYLDNPKQRRTNLLFCAAFNQHSATFLAQHLAARLADGSKQHNILRTLKTNLVVVLAFGWFVRNVKVVMCGKFGGNNRASMETFVLGEMKVTGQTYNLDVSYGYAVAETFTGSFGLHLWITRRTAIPMRSRVKGRGV